MQADEYYRLCVLRRFLHTITQLQVINRDTQFGPDQTHNGYWRVAKELLENIGVISRSY